jgi:hypothetical protein
MVLWADVHIGETVQVPHENDKGASLQELVEPRLLHEALRRQETDGCVRHVVQCP